MGILSAIQYGTHINSFPLIIQTVNNCVKIRGSLAKGFIVGGASAGANLAAAAINRALKDPFFEHHKITGQLLQIPVLLHPAAYPPKSVGSTHLSPIIHCQQICRGAVVV